MPKKVFMKNVVILTLTSFLLRTAGLFLRTYLARRILPEGMGVYQLILSVYVLAVTMVTAGISTAVIRIITEAFAKRVSLNQMKDFMKKSCGLAFGISLFVMLLFYVLAKPIGMLWLKDARTIASIRILIWALPFISISSCLKGYFIATSQISRNSISQLLEQCIRIFLIVILLKVYPGGTLERTCCFLMMADVISEMASWMYLQYLYHLDMKIVSKGKNTSFSFRYFFQIAFPMMVNKFLSTFLKTMENVMIPAKLTIFTLSNEIALSEFGMLKAMALPLIFFPASFLTAISTLMLPEASKARTLKQGEKLKNLVCATFSFTISIGILMAYLFYFYHEEIGSVFYPHTNVWYYLKYLSFLIPFMYLESAITGIMQGLNEQRNILKYNIMDSLIRIMLIIFFVPRWGIKALLIMMYVSNIMTSSLNASRVLIRANTKFDGMNWLVKPILSVISSGYLCEMILKNLCISNLCILLAFKAIFIGGLYGLFLLLFGIFPYVPSFRSSFLKKQ